MKGDYAVGWSVLSMYLHMQSHNNFDPSHLLRYESMHKAQ